jgi:hypothetical protein
MPPTQEPLLTAAEVKQMIAACIGGTGKYAFRKWTQCSPPVLTRHFLPEYQHPRYSLSEVRKALGNPAIPSSTAIAS